MNVPEGGTSSHPASQFHLNKIGSSNNLKNCSQSRASDSCADLFVQDTDTVNEDDSEDISHKVDPKEQKNNTKVFTLLFLCLVIYIKFLKFLERASIVL